MDKDTLKEIIEYCLERAKASRDKEDKLYNKLRYYDDHTYQDTDTIELRGDFYRESGRLDAFLEIANKLMNVKEDKKDVL